MAVVGLRFGWRVGSGFKRAFAQLADFDNAYFAAVRRSAPACYGERAADFDGFGFGR